MKLRKRTQAREIAAQLLYQDAIWRKVEGGAGNAEGKDLERPDAEAFIASSTGDPEVREFARTLYQGAVDHIPEADRLVSEVLENWTLDRVATMDLAILRLAVFELIELAEIPARVVLNEAIELAKKYSTSQSGSFINGILDRLLFLRHGESSSLAEGSRRPPAAASGAAGEEPKGRC
jgi:N utilization substance protein B